MTNPFNFGTPVPPHKFVGRWQQIDVIVEDLVNNEGHSHAIIGGRRFGKSSFLETLQYSLLKRLNKNDSKDWYVFPLPINLKRLENISADGVFGLILNMLYRYFTSKRLRNELGLIFDLDLTNAKLSYFSKHNRTGCTLQEFEKIIDEFLELFADIYGFLRLVFLMDEAEAVVKKEWTESLFDKLRSLVSEGELKNYVRLVIAGSSEIIEVKQSGSPLLNMMKMTYLESFSKKDIMKIIQWVNNIPQKIADIVFQQCGGHPYITQYLMHYIYESGVDSLTKDFVLSLANKFKHERYADLYKWQHEIGISGQFIYKYLQEKEEWLTEEKIRKLINNPSLKVDLSLVALCHHGLAIHDGKWHRYHYSGDLFKSWFNENILHSLPTQQSQADSLSVTQGKAPNIRIHLKDQVFPTVYCYSLTEKEYPLVICEINNTEPNCIDCLVSIEAEIQGFSDPCSDTIKIAPGEIKSIKLLPTITHEARLTLNEIRKTVCRIIVRIHEKTGAGVLFDKTYSLQLHSADTALLATEKADGNIEDLTDYLSIFVTSHRPEIEQVVKKAADRHPDLSIVGYQGDHKEAREIVRSQVNAFFNTLKQDYKLLYTNAPLNFGKQAVQITQRVRLPIESLKMGQTQANCIDGTILFASILENVGIEPLLVIVPGHAFIGWRVWNDVNEYDFLETTMIGTDNFKKALECGNSQYYDAAKKGFENRDLFDPNGFIRIVDVTACREKKIYPIM
jgi:hypothetical protein